VEKQAEQADEEPVYSEVEARKVEALEDQQRETDDYDLRGLRD